ncbi:hypothetical protein ScPMuIL_012486 [Solemya velum]
MSERKVLNKYYPPDFDPSKIPKAKGNRNAKFCIRLMAPCNMRCDTCGEYIYKGKKFNSRKEDVEDEFYLGLRIFRFYIKCPRCVAEIAFKTDLKNTDYTLEAGATRLFEAEKLARQMAEEEMKQKEEDELNPMKVLENRTKASRMEMEQIDALEELRDMNSRQAKVDYEKILKEYGDYEVHLKRLQEEEDEKEIQSIFGKKGDESMKRLQDDGSGDEEPPAKKLAMVEKATDILTQDETFTKSKPVKTHSVWPKKTGSMSSKEALSKLVVKKKTNSKDISRSSSTNTGSKVQTLTTDGTDGDESGHLKEQIKTMSGLSKTATVPNESSKTATMPNESLKTATVPNESLKTATVPNESLKTATVPNESLKTATVPNESLKTATVPNESLKTATMPNGSSKTASVSNGSSALTMLGNYSGSDSNGDTDSDES